MANDYRNIIRPGIRSSVTQDPNRILEDIDEKIRKLSPYKTPLQTLGNFLKNKGAKPKGHEVKTMQYHSFDPLDWISATTFNDAAAGPRFARLTPDQISRPDTQSVMFYKPQDKLHLMETDQVVEVVMTADAALKVSGQEITLPTSLTGGTASRSLTGTIVVKNIEPAPLIPFTTGNCYFMGRTIYESQKIEGVGNQRDVIYDINYVEHKETVLTMTEDAHDLIQMKGPNDWIFQNQETLEEFKTSVDLNCIWSKRALDTTEPRRPKHHMKGLFHTVKTNVGFYNPGTVTDFEAMFSRFAMEQAFRYNPNGKSKIAIAGAKFLYNFNMAFRDYRRTSDMQGVGKEIGLDFQSYYIPGGYKINFIPSELLRSGTKHEDWCFVIDPTQGEWRIVKDYESRMWKNNDERDYKIMIEWQGTISWHLEQAHAILRT